MGSKKAAQEGACRHNSDESGGWLDKFVAWRLGCVCHGASVVCTLSACYCLGSFGLSF